MQITAAVLRDRTGRYELEEVSLAESGPGQILVRIVGVGQCHTDPLAAKPRGPASDHSADAIAVHHRLEHGAHRVSALRPGEFGAARLRLGAELITQHRIVQ